MKSSDTNIQNQDGTKDSVHRWFTALRLAEYIGRHYPGGKVKPIGKGKFRIEGAGAGGLEIVTKDGTGQWYIHAEDKGGDCFEAFERFENITGFPDQLRRGAELAGITIPTNGHTAAPAPSGTPEAVYLYTDADGNPVRKKQRYPGKRFAWYHPEGGKTVKGAGNAPPLLYRLPDVIEAAAKGGVVWIVEGEKDADAMTAKGCTATTAEHGGTKGKVENKWAAEYTAALQGAHCVVIADRDETGRTFAEHIAAELQGTAETVQIIETPKGKDAAEFFELGGTVSELVEIADNVPVWIPEGERITSWADAAARIGEISWAWSGWIPNGLLTMLVSEPGKGKSALALRIAASFIRGDSWPDGTPFTAETGSVIWCESEGALSVNVDRAKKAGVPYDHMISPLLDPLEEFSIDQPEHIERLRTLATRPDVRCIILDSLSGATQQDENSSAMLHRVKELSAIATMSGKPFLLLHHLNKGLTDGDNIHQRQVRGSSAITQTARVIWAIDAPDETDEENRRLAVIKNNLDRYAPPLGFRISDGGLSFSNNAPRKRRTDSVKDAAADLLSDVLADGPVLSAEVEAMAAERGISPNGISRAKKILDVQSTRKDGKWYMSLKSDRTPPPEQTKADF